MFTSRRRFLAVGALGAAALATAGWLHFRRGAAPSRKTLSNDGVAVIAAVVPAMLEGALPDDAEHRRNAIDETVSGVDTAIAGLPPLAQRELAQLFALLTLEPARVVLIHTLADWTHAELDEVQAFLERLRSSRWALQKAAYNALHQLVMGAWYGNPRSWQAIDYPGPPVITA